MKWHIGVAAVAVLVLPAALSAQEKVTLKHRYAPGTYVLRVKRDQKRDTSIGDREPRKSSITHLTVFELTAEKPDASGQQKVLVTIRRIQLDTQAKYGKASYDSANPDASAESSFADVYRAMLDTPIEVLLSADGKPLKVTGMDRLWNRAAEALGGGVMLDVVKEEFSERMFEYLVGEWASELPDRAVAKGDTWTVNREVDMPASGRTTVKLEHKLRSLEESSGTRVAVIDCTGTLIKGAADSQPATGSTLMKVEKMDMGLSGTLKFDVTSSMLTSSVVDMKGVVEMPGPGLDGTVTKMSMKIEGTDEATLTPGKYVPPATQPATQPASAPAGQ